MTSPGSYANGFAPRDGQPLYPELWRGCVGAWAPCLGPTGLTLRDWSGRCNHGTFFNSSASTAWSVSVGRYAADFPTSANEYVSCANPQLGGLSQMSLSYWLIRTGNNSAANGNGVIGAWGLQGTGATNQFVSLFVANAIRFTVGAGTVVGVTASQSIDLGSLYHIACVYTGSAVQIYVNGIFGGSAALTGAIVAGAGELRFGNYAANEQSICSIDDVRVYSRAVSQNEIRLLASRRGIAYELAPRRRSRIFTGGFKAYWAARKAQIIGGGL
jgi:hypothetical protein